MDCSSHVTRDVRSLRVLPIASAPDRNILALESTAMIRADGKASANGGTNLFVRTHTHTHTHIHTHTQKGSIHIILNTNQTYKVNLFVYRPAPQPRS
jgi:hypothetical protein